MGRRFVAIQAREFARFGQTAHVKLRASPGVRGMDTADNAGDDAGTGHSETADATDGLVGQGQIRHPSMRNQKSGNTGSLTMSPSKRVAAVGERRAGSRLFSEPAKSIVVCQETQMDRVRRTLERFDFQYIDGHPVRWRHHWP